jgi:hypothetical protein
MMLGKLSRVEWRDFSHFMFASMSRGAAGKKLGRLENKRKFLRHDATWNR